MDKDFEYWYQKLGLISMIVYFILSIQYYDVYKKMMFQVVSYADAVLFKWVKTYLIAFLVMLLLPIAFDILTYFSPDMNSYTRKLVVLSFILDCNVLYCNHRIF